VISTTNTGERSTGKVLASVANYSAMEHFEYNTNDTFWNSQRRNLSYLKPKVLMPDLHTLPEGSRPSAAIRNNGPVDLVIERYKIRELAEGWPCYR
jgi:hypothetical protein